MSNKSLILPRSIVNKKSNTVGLVGADVALFFVSGTPRLSSKAMAPETAVPVCGAGNCNITRTAPLLRFFVALSKSNRRAKMSSQRLTAASEEKQDLGVFPRFCMYSSSGTMDLKASAWLTLFLNLNWQSTGT
eukprot:Lithocolla_globosa_v1_NODE_1023_length_2944_cov_20.131533.p3 type:complete len:133 gc:universal NODE_1023_length_2944_cov_20.131533:414-812(+)